MKHDLIKNNSVYQYLLLNYDKFNQEDSTNLILNLVKEKVDFVILDEIHFVKKRDEESSQRRRNLDGLMTAVRKKNNNVKVLGLSATPVVNNLMEGRSLLELITGKLYDDVAVRPTIPNAVTLYEKLSTISIRELPQYNIRHNRTNCHSYTCKEDGGPNSIQLSLGLIGRSALTSNPTL
jgi:replicative superfamily II helicase